ncbi:phosphotransferase [Pseudoroseicyclus sp. H15]
MTEEELTGGNTSRVVRVGETVRRSMGSRRASVHGLLQHLEAKGFAAAPRFLGIDAEGREILSLLPGGAAPADLLERLDVLDAAGRLLRKLHDATADMEFGRAEDWPRADMARAEVICHHDFAPYNLLFEGGLPSGTVDFDLAGPGARRTDLAYLAWWLCPFGTTDQDLAPKTQAEVAAGAPRLQRLCAAYGLPADVALLNEVQAVLHRMGDRAAVASGLGEAVAETLAAEGHLAFWQREAAGFEQLRPALERAL